MGSANTAGFYGSFVIQNSANCVVLNNQMINCSTAGFIDPGFSGHITLELSNVANLPVKLYPGMKIGQLCLIKLSSAAEHQYGSALYGSRYQGQRGPTPSKSWLNFHKTKIQ